MAKLLLLETLIRWSNCLIYDFLYAHADVENKSLSFCALVGAGAVLQQ